MRYMCLQCRSTKFKVRTETIEAYMAVGRVEAMMKEQPKQKHLEYPVYLRTCPNELNSSTNDHRALKRKQRPQDHLHKGKVASQ